MMPNDERIALEWWNGAGPGGWRPRGVWPSREFRNALTAWLTNTASAEPRWAVRLTGLDGEGRNRHPHVEIRLHGWDAGMCLNNEQRGGNLPTMLEMTLHRMRHPHRLLGVRRMILRTDAAGVVEAEGWPWDLGQATGRCAIVPSDYAMIPIDLRDMRHLPHTRGRRDVTEALQSVERELTRPPTTDWRDTQQWGAAVITEILPARELVGANETRWQLIKWPGTAAGLLRRRRGTKTSTRQLEIGNNDRTALREELHAELAAPLLRIETELAQTTE